MSALLRRALVAPGVLAAAALVALAIAGSAAALTIVAIGASGILGFHLWHLVRLGDWANGARGGDVPEGRGAWAEVFAAIHRRARARAAYEQELRQVIERFRQAASAIPDGILVLDARNRIDWANARALAQFGLALDVDRGQPVVNLIRQPEFHRYVEAGDFGMSVIVPSNRDPVRALALQLVPFAADQKLLIARDVTEVEAVSRMRRDFIANVSHELKTPLTVIHGFIETLQDVDVDPQRRTRFLQLMQEQAASMQRLVADLLTLSVLENEQNPVQDERFEVSPLLRGIAAEARALSKGAHTIALDVRDASIVNGSRDELSSAFGNLVSNAVRYTAAGGTVDLAWRVDDDGSGVFAVTDTGIGIAPEHVPRLTERFYRVDRSRSRATGGTGLGLAIVKHVLLRHQAGLEIASERGIGSTFSVRMPARRVLRVAAPDAGDGEAWSTDVRSTITSNAAPRETGS